MTDETPIAAPMGSPPARGHAFAPCPDTPDAPSFVSACMRLVQRVYYLRNRYPVSAPALYADVRALLALVKTDPSQLADARPMLAEFWAIAPPCDRSQEDGGTHPRKRAPTPAPGAKPVRRPLAMTAKAIAKREQDKKHRDAYRERIANLPWPTVTTVALDRPITHEERARYTAEQADVWDVMGIADIVTESQRKAWGFEHARTLAQRDQPAGKPSILAIVAEREHAAMTARIHGSASHVN